MNARLQAGVEMALEKVAAEEAGNTHLLAKAVSQGLQKRAEDQLVQQQAKSENTKASSASSAGMEDKNSGYGKSTNVLDDDPSKNQNAEETGLVTNAHDGKNITTEASGMKDLSLDKNASNKDQIQSMLESLVAQQ
jgi:hypothetical protein